MLVFIEYRHISLYGASQIMPFFFYILKVCGNPEFSNSISAIFLAAFAHFMSLYHILVVLKVFPTFSL